MYEPSTLYPKKGVLVRLSAAPASCQSASVCAGRNGEESGGQGFSRRARALFFLHVGESQACADGDNIKNGMGRV